MAAGTDDVSGRLRELFLDELDEQVERLVSGFEQLSLALPSVPPAVIRELFRSAHSLKGAAQATGTQAVADICHQLEDVLADVRDGSRSVDMALLTTLGSATDSLAEAGRRLRLREEPRPADVQAIAGGAVATRQRPLRVAPHKLNNLLTQAQQLVVATHRSKGLVQGIADVSARLIDDEGERLRDHQVLRDALGTAADTTTVRAVLDRAYSRSRLATAQLDRLARQAEGYERGLHKLADDLSDAAWLARAVPFTDATLGLGRLVRELADESGKQARFVVDAADVEVDKALVGTLDDILRHLVRNAMAHGIEPAADRVAAGKPSVGTITITATLRGGGIEVVVEDDGRGIDVDAVRQAVRALGEVADTPDERVLEALFRPGLSTARTVNEVSGRGVGLDAVRAAAEAKGGTVTLHHAPGSGVSVAVTVPLNLSLLRTVLVRAGGELVAVSSSAIRRLAGLPSDCPVVDGRAVAHVDGAVIPVVRLVDALDWVDAAPAAPSAGPQQALVVTLPEGAVAVVVDEFVTEQDVMMQAVGPRLTGVATLLGTTQLDDGSVTLVVSAASCARRALSRARSQQTGTDVQERMRSAQVLLVEDTLTTRELVRSILEGAGYAVSVAGDGVHAWELLQRHEMDAVVTDVNMPRMDGIALCRAIRSTPRWAQLPVILVTSLASDDDRQRGMEAGADAYLIKTDFDRSDLLAALARLL